MNAEDVANYLQEHPEFFNAYADVLALMTLPDPHTGRAISITEKQMLTMRDKVRGLEAQLADLLAFGRENDAISDKVHALAVALIAATDEAGVVRVLYSHLGGAFAVPHVALRLWSGVAEGSSLFVSASDPACAAAMAMQKPYCGTTEAQPALAWFGDAATTLRSMVQVPLRDAGGICIGLLVMASEDAHRFYPELGTLYLERIGDLASAAFRRILHAPT